MAKPLIEAGRARILKISEQLFTEHGYNAVSIRDISQACNLTKAALYYHFPSKDALYGEVIDIYAHRLKQQMWEAGQQDGRTVDRLIAILSEYVRLTADRRAYMFQKEKIKTSLKKNTIRNTHHMFLKAILDPVDKIIEQAIENKEIPPLPSDLSPASMLVGMTHGMLVHQNLEETQLGSMDKIKTVVEIFWRGLSGDPNPNSVDSVEQYLGVKS